MTSQEHHTITLWNVAYCPDAQDNLISESQMDKRGLEIQKRDGQVQVSKQDRSILIEGRLRHNLYELNCAVAAPSSNPSDVAFSAQIGESLKLWHQQFSHMHPDGL